MKSRIVDFFVEDVAPMALTIARKTLAEVSAKVSDAPWRARGGVRAGLVLADGRWRARAVKLAVLHEHRGTLPASLAETLLVRDGLIPRVGVASLKESRARRCLAAGIPSATGRLEARFQRRSGESPGRGRPADAQLVAEDGANWRRLCAVAGDFRVQVAMASPTMAALSSRSSRS